MLDREQRPLRATAAVRLVDAVAAHDNVPDGIARRRAAVDRDRQVAREREQRDRVLDGIGANQHQRVDYTPYEGMHVQGIPDTVLLRGKVIVRNGEYVGGKGGGQYLRRATFSEELTEG